MAKELDRRLIYLLVFLALSLPILYGVAVKPARMHSADELFRQIDGLKLQRGEIAWLALDFGPSTKAENQAQAEVIVEHLLRRRIPFVLSSLLAETAGLLTSIPLDISRRLAAETGENWEYGADWINLGYQPGAALFLQKLSKSEDLAASLGRDALGNNLSELKAFSGVKTLRNVKLLVEVTGSVGVFSAYVQFFRVGDYKPLFGHACTSITIPEAYIYLDSKQLDGLLEGLAGAAWYSQLLRDQNPKRKEDRAMLTNTGLGVAQLLIIVLVLFGNLSDFFNRGGAR